MSKEIKSFSEFWPFYLSQHQNPINRRLHFFGTLTAHVALVIIIWASLWQWLWILLPFGYGPAWYGHMKYEKNRPATFTYPWWSLVADFKLFYLTFLGQLKKE